MFNDHEVVPLYVQIYHIILDKIVKGEWPVDSKIPSENELCKEYSVSRMTVRLALDKLKDQGYITRRRGQGTFVATPMLEQKLTSFYSFSDKEYDDGLKLGSQVLSLEVTEADEKTSEKLEILPGTEVFLLKRIRILKGLPFAYEESYIAVSSCPMLDAESIEADGLYNTFFKLNHLVLDYAYEVFEAVSLDTEVAKYLGAKAHQPAMKIERIAKEGDHPIEYCNSIVRGDRIKYNVILRK